MATKRRSTRERKQPPKYFKESSSEDEGDDDKTKVAKQKLKQLMYEDSDAESDFENDIKEKEIQESSDEDEEDYDSDAANIKQSLKHKVPESKSFRLSESESSDDEDSGENSSNSKKKFQNLETSGGNIFLRQFSHDVTDDNSEENNKKLLALAGNLEKINDVWKETTNGKPTTPKKETKGKGKKRKSLDVFETVKKPKPDDGSNALDSISKLLAQGEGVKDEYVDESDDGNEIKKEPIMSSTGVEVTVPVPEHLRKKKKKGFDLAAYLKRQIAKEQRELSLRCHEANFVCLVAHLLHLNTVTRDQSLQCLAMSLVPSSHVHTPDTLTLTRLGHMVSWLRETVPVNKHSDMVSIKDMVTRLETAMSTLLVMNDLELVLIFVLMCRALGCDTRLVISFNLPAKSDNSMFTSPTEEPSTSQTNKSSDTKKSDSEEDKKGKVKDSPSKSSHHSKLSEKKKKEDRNSKSRKSKRSPSKECKIKESQSKSSRSRDDSSKNVKNSRNEKSPAKKKEETKSKRSSRLEAAVNKRKSKSLAPTVTEDAIVKTIQERSEDKKSKSPKSKESKMVFKQSYWVEIYMIKEKKWIPVDVLAGKVNNSADIESRINKPVIYVYAANSKGKIKDVTRRYNSNYLTQCKKLRFEEKWIDQTLKPWIDKENDKEDKELTKKSEEAPLPTSVAGFKNHPLYVLQRHLLKFEAIYPADAPTLGFIKGEAVYARECVHILNGRTAWLKEGRVVRIGEEPYKVVKARPKWDRMTGSKKADEPLDLFGHWQTELYIPPPAVDGKVPRNEYGNVELFKPWMLPKGCVHIEINGMQSVIRKTGIDAAPAMMGWDFSGGGAHPILHGYVVCEENVDILMDAWNQDQELKAQREHDKREKRVLDNWKRLVKGLMFREKMRQKYIDN